MLTGTCVRVRLIVGPILLEEDRLSLHRLTDPRARSTFQQRMGDRTLEDAVEQLRAGSSAARQELFCRLIASGQVEIRFAFPAHIPDSDVYHEKFGIFELVGDCSVAFTGSANETGGGHRRNFEQLDVYRSWVPGDIDRVEDKKRLFHETWLNQAEGLDVVEVSPETLAKVRALGSPNQASRSLPQDKWRHQREAVDAFLATSERRGVLEMATGTGKTRTSLLVAHALQELREISGLIVCASGTDLLNQWYRNLLDWSGSQGQSVYRHYSTYHEVGSFTLIPNNSILVCSRQALPQLVRSLSSNAKSRLMMIHDEVHGFGSPSMREQLSGFHQEFAAVLGLSATPEREYDEEGNEFIESEIGAVVYEFNLEKAIKRGILCPFNYIPVEYALTEGDGRRIKAVFAARSAANAEGEPWPIEKLYREIAKVYKTAEEKPARFAELLSRRPELLHAAVVFVETHDYALPFIESVSRYTTAYSTYFDDDPPARLQELSSGVLDCVVCCKRLSEGVDIQRLKGVFLVSADKARLQTIQRIGRTLRTDPNDPDKVATVVDFVMEEADPDHPDTLRRGWLEYISRFRPQEGES